MARSSLPERGQDASEMHSALMANRADIQGLSSQGLVAGFPVEELCIGFWRWGIEKLSAKGKPVAAMAVGEEAEVADLGKLLGKDVKEEAADELVGVESHASGAVVAVAVAPPEGHLPVLECQQAVIGDGDAVRIAAEVIEDLSGSPKGRFGVDDPFMFAVCVQELGEGLGIGQGYKI